MSSSLLGTQLGQFRFVDELGKGGMGEVYLGYDEKLERKVALKTLRRDRLDPESKARFLREARILSQLAHPGICQIFDLIEGEATDVLVLELIQGKNLREVLRSGPGYPLQLQIARELTAVLVAAHAKGVIHRDLKPDNAMLTEEGHVKVLDFGLSRSITVDETIALQPTVRRAALVEKPVPSVSAETDPEPDQTLLLTKKAADSWGAMAALQTEVGTVMGTLDYMSPEQAQGAAVTPASDIYSLGLIFQEMFTGASPYREKPDSSFEARLERAQQGETVRVMGLDPDLGSLIERMKGIDPYLRPTAVEVASRLLALEERPARKRKRFLIAACMVVLSLFSLGTAYQAVRISKERTRANQEADAAKKSLAFLKGIFEQVNPSGKQGPTVTVKELLDHGRSRIGDLREQPVLQAQIEMLLGSLYQTFGLYNDALPLLEKARGTFEQLGGPDPAELLVAMNQVANLYFEQGRYAEAEAIQKRALALREKTFGPEHPSVGSALNNLANLYSMQWRYAEAEALYKRDLAITEKALGPDHPNVGDSLNNLAASYSDQGKYAEAEPLQRRALAIIEKASGPEHPNVASSLNNLANLASEQGHYAAAEPLYQRALAIREKAFGPEHPSVADSVNSLADHYFRQGHFAQAEPLHKRAMAIREKALGGDHPKVADSLSSWADNVSQQGKFSEAEPLYQRALVIREKALGPDDPDVAANLVKLATLYQRSGRSAAVEPLRSRAEAILDKSFGSRAAWPVGFQFELCRLEVLQGHSEAALRGLTQCIAKGYSSPGFGGHPDFVALRGDPQFEKLVVVVKQRVGAKADLH